MPEEFSKTYQLSRYDVRSRLVNVIIFLGPVLVYILTQIANGVAPDWNTAYMMIVGLVLNLLKKFVQDNTQPV